MEYADKVKGKGGKKNKKGKKVVGKGSKKKRDRSRKIKVHSDEDEIEDKVDYEYTNNEIYWKHIKKVKNNAKLCFIHTPKCGGSYARQIFNDLKIRNKGHSQAKTNDGITFTIIRTPGERFESLLNYRLGGLKPNRDWPKHLKYKHDKSVTLNEIVDEMSDKEILGFRPYRSLTHWSKNIDVFITIDNLHNFLSCFGYSYDTNKYSKKRVSKKKEVNLMKQQRIE